MMGRIASSLRRWAVVHRSKFLLAAALACGALAAFGARGYINGQIELERARLLPQQDEIEVVVAKHDLGRGDVVGPQSMAVRRIPRAFVPGSAVLPDRFETYVGARLNTAMRGGETLLHAAMDGVDASTFSTKVRDGIRALTIAVDEVNSISGMLQPGDRIDLQLTIRPPQRAGLVATPAELTAPLMQDVLVLATGRQVRSGADPAGGGGRGFSTITVEVSPEQAQRLIVAQRGGRLTALLRNRDDRREVTQRPLDVYDLLNLPAGRRSPTGPIGPEIIVGGKGPLTPMLPHGASPLSASALGSLLGAVATAPPSSAAGGGEPPMANEDVTATRLRNSRR